MDWIPWVGIDGEVGVGGLVPLLHSPICVDPVYLSIPSEIAGVTLAARGTHALDWIVSTLQLGPDSDAAPVADG